MKGGREEDMKGCMKGKTTVATVMYDKNDVGVRGVRAFPTILLFPATNVTLEYLIEEMFLR